MKARTTHKQHVTMNKYTEIESREALSALLKKKSVLRHYAFQNIEFGEEAMQCFFEDCIFFGCNTPDAMLKRLSPDCYILPTLPSPFNMFLARLYTASDLYKGYNHLEPETFDSCYDTRIYRHYISHGKQAGDIAETVARALHDHSVSDALHDMLAKHDERSVVAIMGGHALLRTDANYRKVVLIGKQLAERGCLVVTGGGPGAMEAAHLGVWLAGHSDEVVETAIALLAHAPSHSDEGWLSSAFELMKKIPRKETHDSIGIPTWFYGHEPATPFASHIAKYFDNSIREDILLTIAKGGIIYSPGSAGTMQEIFQDAAQNHYLTCGYASPMVFLGCEYWRAHLPVYPLLQELAKSGCYKNLLLTLTDSADEAVEAILKFRLTCEGRGGGKKTFF